MEFRKKVLISAAICIISGLSIFAFEISMVGQNNLSEILFRFTGEFYKDIPLQWKETGKYPENIAYAARLPLLPFILRIMIEFMPIEWASMTTIYLAFIALVSITSITMKRLFGEGWFYPTMLLCMNPMLLNVINWTHIEVIFIFLIVASFYYFHKNRLWVSSLFIITLGLSRSTYILIYLGLLLVLINRCGINLKGYKKYFPIVISIISGYIFEKVIMFYLYKIPFAYYHSLIDYWGQGIFYGVVQLITENWLRMIGNIFLIFLAVFFYLLSYKSKESRELFILGTPLLIIPILFVLDINGLPRYVWMVPSIYLFGSRIDRRAFSGLIISFYLMGLIQVFPIAFNLTSAVLILSPFALLFLSSKYVSKGLKNLF